jgi:ribosomal protein S18 acetylase RimI-like enzyme
MRVRPADACDEEDLLHLAQRLSIGVAPWRDRQRVSEAVVSWVRASLTSAEVQVFVADLNGAVVGFVSVSVKPHWAGDHDAYIGELVVDANHEGRGVGRALVESAVRWAQDHDLFRITLETGAANLRARKFYATLGFEEEDVRITRSLGPVGPA